MRDSLRSLEEFCELWWRTVERTVPSSRGGRKHLTADRVQTRRQPSCSPSLHPPAVPKESCDCLVKELKWKMPWESRYSWTQVTQGLCLFRHVVLVSPRNGRVRLGNRMHVVTHVTSSQARQEAGHLPSCPTAVEEMVVSTGP